METAASGRWSSARGRAGSIVATLFSDNKISLRAVADLG
jgi:hypothetical protein